MKDIGDLCGLDYDTAYYLKYGEYPKREKMCEFTPALPDWETIHEPDKYICWQGCWLGDSIQWLAY